ncbi:MAG: FtsX-like permease family protein [Parachlamydiaceae bacterium]|nr:FtsX-like permease family protein [Parachlamydiaceae bacterium]
MISLALKMLIGNRASCIGVIFGIFLATLLISQQSAIFLGLVARSYRIVTDISEPTVWVMDPATESEDKLRSLPIGYLDVVRGVSGIEWAVPLNSALIPVITPLGKFNISQLYGIDDATLIGAPSVMLEGSVLDLRREGGVIVDVYSTNNVLATTSSSGKKIPLKLGDSLEINGKRSVVVGICEATQGFYPQPIIYTSFSQFQSFVPGMGNRMSFVLAKTNQGADVLEVSNTINVNSGLHAVTREQFQDRIMRFFLGTGILINFGMSVALGIIIGFSIAGQIFYIMTLENITYYALIKAVGGSEKMIFMMIICQAALVGVIGYALGIGVTVLWGLAIKHTSLAFLFPWQLLLFSFAIVLIICIFTAALSIQKVFRADPKMLMGT